MGEVEGMGFMNEGVTVSNELGECRRRSALANLSKEPGRLEERIDVRKTSTSYRAHSYHTKGSSENNCYDFGWFLGVME